ncbi:DNA-directed DNA polymerase [Maudiozyma barnettii]|uniref:DNA polymerase n=1 Tax=Maudiozyma barnettii TaxID=61262 RepID=A0A8H2VCF2_9SACH|nr:DNA-directed DNA polymerase [Kazachstania barnettii]CAB4252707.1 similar to Saccharomyces cerevisiae YPL167C REV3 Catalytic subunit of DNA polymerase zeta, involved in translesion synthesis during post-replication repair [Kazachstania barnettii]
MTSESFPLSSSILSSLSEDEIHLAMNHYDFYMTKPTIIDRSFGESLPINRFNKVPVIRIYGCLPSGHQVLCHIHGIFPYIFLEYDGLNSDTSSVMNQKCAQLHIKLENGVIQHYSKDNRSSNANTITGNLNHIANVSIVKGVPFYGFHVGWSAFYKITLLNPSQVNKISDLLRDGSLLSKKVRTFESHIPYLLQFSADFNLFGCEWINAERCYFREPVLNTILDTNNLMMTFELKTFLSTFCKTEHCILNKNEFPRVGNGLLEIDILPQFITNIDKLEHRDTPSNFPQSGEDTLASIIKYHVSSTKRMVDDLNSQRSLFSLDTYEKPSTIERTKIIKQTWQSAEDYTNFFNKAKNNMKLHSYTPKFSNFIKNDPRFESISDIYKAIKELWPIIPKYLVSQEGIVISEQLQDTSFEDYSIVNNIESGDEESEEINDNGVNNKSKSDDVQMVINEKNMRNDQSQETLAIEQSNSSWRDKISQSMDFVLTQNMAKRRKVLSQNISQKMFPRSELKKGKNGIRFGKNAYRYKMPHFQGLEIVDDLKATGFPIIDYKNLYFGNPRDLDTKPYVYAGKRFDINSTHLIDRVPLTFEDNPVILDDISSKNYFETWRYNKKPPTFCSVKSETNKTHILNIEKPQIANVSRSNKFVYKFKSCSPNSKPMTKKMIQQTLTHFSLEIHVNTREDFKPDPILDAVSAIFWKLDDKTYPFDFNIETEGIMIVNPNIDNPKYSQRFTDAAGQIPIMIYESEFDMLDALTDLIILFDPDILSGFEVNLSSWGYLILRSSRIHKFNLTDELSRVTFKWKNNKFETNSRLYTHSSGTTVTGRYVLNVWRIIRANVALTQYTIENLAFTLLHERIPHFSYSDLTDMWNNMSSITYLKSLFHYWMTRVRINIELLKKQDFIDKTIEQAKLIGIDFHSVYFRGSQYKVESFLIRLCKTEGYVLLSPSKKDVQDQKALECVPLVMEPESAFYKSPMVILDFQSLYPSIMMAYNYCYSTMLGRVRELKEKNNIVGVDNFPLQKGLLTLLGENITIAPNGMVYVKPSIRKSTLSVMLKEILDIRVMVKKTISELGPRNEALKKLLSNKQLALKLLANVTYGYTSASFSGRMPCSDLADSVVQTGRETLERAISMIESNDRWTAKVVYGDTDSLFIYLPGRSKKDAFDIGQEISIAITKANPDPIFLKLEKVYFPSILVSKKRYVGYSFENLDQKVPILDSKGIETVRRDGHPAQQQIVEQTLRILFETKDLSKVKHYVQGQFSKIYQGNVSIQDFCFAKEVKLGRYKSESTAPAGAVVAKRKMEKDKRSEPQYKERVPYLVVRSKLGETLRNRSISPEEFMADESLELDSDYYIIKTLIPPLSRLLNITGINVSDWVTNLKRTRKGLNDSKDKRVKVLGESILCCNCKKNHIFERSSSLCQECMMDERKTAVSLLMNKAVCETRYEDLSLVCRTCSYMYTHDAGLIGNDIASRCDSYDCPIYYSRMKNKKNLQSSDATKSNMALKYLDKW